MAEEKRLTLSDAQGWGEFRVGDVFKVTYGKFIKNNKSGNVPYITTTANNNGLGGYVEGTPMFDGNCITVASDGSVGATFYQDKPFSASNIVSVLQPIGSARLNKYIALFFCNMIRAEAYKYNYGKKFSVDRVRNTVLLLPATPDGLPDYDFMENYIKQLYDDFTDRISFYTKPIEENKEISLSDREWKEFQLQHLFKVTGSKTTAKNDLESIGGNKYPYITTQATNNSIAGFYDYATEKGNCIIAESAVAGFVSYQAKDFSASAHVEKLMPYYKEFNQYHGMFIVSVIRYVNTGKYNYGHKFNQQRIRETMISLPVTPEGQPDYDFMEQYIKSLPFSKALEI